MASVRKRTYKDGSAKWVVDFKDDNGKRVLKTFDHKKSADAFRATIVVEVQAGRYIPKSRAMSWPRAVDDWLNNCCKRAKMGDRMTNATLRYYEGAVVRLEPFFGRMNIGDLTLAHVQVALDELFKDYAPASLMKSVQAAYAVLAFAVESGKLRDNPVSFRRLRLLRLTKKARVPPKDALRAILSAVNGERARFEPHDTVPLRKAIINLALFTGMRRGEICGLRWSDVDFKRGMIQCEHSRSIHDGLKSTKTKAGLRTFEMAAPVREALEGLKRHRGGLMTGAEDFVLVTRCGKPIWPCAIYTDHWCPVLVKAGLMERKRRCKAPFRFHDLRHAAISLLIEQRVSPVHIKQFAGHSSIQTTIDVYDHLFLTDSAVLNASAEVATELLATRVRPAAVNS